MDRLNCICDRVFDGCDEMVEGCDEMVEVCDEVAEVCDGMGRLYERIVRIHDGRVEVFCRSDRDYRGTEEKHGGADEVLRGIEWIYDGRTEVLRRTHGITCRKNWIIRGLKDAALSVDLAGRRVSMKTTKDTNPSGAVGLSHVKLGRALNNPARWKILAALLKHEVLPSSEIAAQTGESRANISKQMAVLRKLGLVETWHTTLYRIPQRFRVPGEMALDFGCALLRLDRIR